MGWNPGYAVISGHPAHLHFALTSITTSVPSAEQNFSLNGLTALKGVKQNNPQREMEQQKASDVIADFTLKDNIIQLSLSEISFQKMSLDSKVL